MHTPAHLTELLALANHYPSPHNGQPIRLKQTGAETFDIFFERQRGLQSIEISFIFSFVSIGIFMEHLALCAKALGHKVEYYLQLPPASSLEGEGLAKVASGTFSWDRSTPDEQLQHALLARQTSRKKYYEDVDDDTAAHITKLAADNGTTLQHLSKKQTQQAIWLNQRAVFDDMFNEPVRRELDHWLRYSQAEKQATKDGLAYDCMELSGPLMKCMVHHPKMLKLPGLSRLLKAYYLRTMTDQSSVFFLRAPFATEQQAYHAGQVIMRIWLHLTEKGYYLHPFGTIMTNKEAHQDFLQMAGVDNESRQKAYLVFIFRGGRSKKPAPSLRLPVETHLLMKRESHD